MRPSTADAADADNSDDGEQRDAPPLWWLQHIAHDMDLHTLALQSLAHVRVSAAQRTAAAQPAARPPAASPLDLLSSPPSAVAPAPMAIASTAAVQMKIERDRVVSAVLAFLEAVRVRVGAGSCRVIEAMCACLHVDVCVVCV